MVVKFKEAMEKLNYACDMKESSGMVSNEYKEVYRLTDEIALAAYEKGNMSLDALVEYRSYVPSEKNIFMKEHSANFADLTEKIDEKINNDKVINLMSQEHKPAVFSKVA